jgi:tRNA pseudouridine38-40 synthase
VRAWASADAPPDFHATHDAAAREYTYHLHAPPERVEDGRARQTLSALAGEHDFHNLTPDDAGTVRDLDATLQREGDFLALRFRAGGFARQLARRLVTVVAESARRGLPEGRIDRLLGPEPLDGPEGVAPAPAAGLVLTGVDYPGLAFEPDPDALAATREQFADERVAAKRRARVVGSVADALGPDGPET